MDTRKDFWGNSIRKCRFCNKYKLVLKLFFYPNYMFRIFFEFLTFAKYKLLLPYCNSNGEKWVIYFGPFSWKDLWSWFQYQNMFSYRMSGFGILNIGFCYSGWKRRVVVGNIVLTKLVRSLDKSQKDINC